MHPAVVGRGGCEGERRGKMTRAMGMSVGLYFALSRGVGEQRRTRSRAGSA